MNSTGKKPPQAKGLIQQPRQSIGHTQPNKPGVAQTKNAVSAQSIKRPVAPPAYRPQSKPPVAQPKTAGATQPKSTQAVPTVYRPQPVARVLQTKKRMSQPARPQVAAPRRPSNPNPGVTQPKKSNAAQAVQRPHTTTTLQSKTAIAQPVKPSLQATGRQVAKPLHPARPHKVVQARLLTDDTITAWVKANPPAYKNGNAKKNLDAYTYVNYFGTKIGQAFDEDDLIKAIAVATTEGIVKAYDKGNLKTLTKNKAVQAAKLTRNREDSDPTMAASMYDYYLGRWFQGKSGHGKNQGNVPAVVWNRISATIDADKYQFGRNCAEVDCLIQAYNTRPLWLQAFGIGKSVFQAARVHKTPTSQDACGGCRTWVSQSGASWT